MFFLSFILRFLSADKIIIESKVINAVQIVRDIVREIVLDPICDIF